MMSPGKGLVRTFALVCVAVTSIFVIGMTVWYTLLLSQPDWCARAVGAAKDTEVRPEYAVGGCFNLLNAQVQALAINSHIALAVVALCLLVLMVLVVAGGRLSFKAGADGLEGDISSEAKGAQAATDAAQDVTDEIVEGADR